MAGARQKPVPPAPETLDRLRTVRAAVSLTPEPETSCCVRLMERADVPAQDDAKTWLSFLRGLELVAATDRGYVRTHDDPELATLADRFLSGIYGARELHDIVERAGPVTPDDAFDRFRDHVPAYERHRSDDWAATWRERVRRLLAWGALFGVFEAAEGGYRLV